VNWNMNGLLTNLYKKKIEISLLDFLKKRCLTIGFSQNTIGFSQIEHAQTFVFSDVQSTYSQGTNYNITFFITKERKIRVIC